MTFEQNAPFMNMTVTEGNGIVNGQPVKKEIISYFQMASETWNCRAACRSLPPRYKTKPLFAFRGRNCYNVSNEQCQTRKKQHLAVYRQDAVYCGVEACRSKFPREEIHR